MRAKAPTAAQKRRMDRVASLGCIACLNLFHDYSPALIHHCYAGRKGWRDHNLILPLCLAHHSTDYSTGFHHDMVGWQKIHGTESDLMAQVQTLLVEVI
jgi:hypothetical protein